MTVDAVGSLLSSTQPTTTASALDQEDFIRLFLTELNYQDPLEPIDNREFLAQIAEFSSLEQARVMGDTLSDLLFVSSGDQVFGLLGRSVTIERESELIVGQVASATYTSNGPLMSVTTSDNQIIPNVRLSQIRRVQ